MNTGHQIPQNRMFFSDWISLSQHWSLLKHRTTKLMKRKHFKLNTMPTSINKHNPEQSFSIIQEKQKNEKQMTKI